MLATSNAKKKWRRLGINEAEWTMKVNFLKEE